MRIVFIGCVQSSASLLRVLIENGFVPAGVVTRDGSPYNSDYEDLTPLCAEAGIPFIRISDVNSADTVRFIEECRPDLIYCFGWSQLIKEQILAIPRLGAVGFHPAKLPKNRGRHPLIWALALGLTETASSFFMMDAQADTGPVISQEIVPITYDDTAETLYKKVVETACKQIITVTKSFENQTIQETPQRKEEGNVWRKRGIQDGRIDWRMSGRAIYNLVRALAKPYPGAHFERNGAAYRVWKAKEVPWSGVENIESGKVLLVRSRTEFFVKAYDGVIHIVECEPISLKEGDYLQ